MENEKEEKEEIEDSEPDIEEPPFTEEDKKV